MSTELAILDPNQMQAAIEYAERLSYSAMIPDAYQGKPANILWAMEYGRTLGLSTVATINGVNVIKGKPTASAALISALVRQAGHRMRIGFDAATMTGWATIVRSDDPDFTFRSEWDLERAVEAELCKVKDGKPFAVDSKGNTLPWKKFYPSMVKARAITEVSRDACEEVLFGLHYTPQELGAEVDEDGDGAPVVVRAQQVPESAPAAPPVPLRTPQPARPHSPAGLERDRPRQPAEDEWTKPAPAEQIEDAEIVPETDPFWDTDEGKHALTVLHALIGQKSGPKTSEERHAGFTRFCHREIKSAKQMRRDEVERMTAAFRKASDFVAPQPKPQSSPEQRQEASARSEAEQLAATDEPDEERLTAHYVDAITSAETAGAVDCEIVLAQAAQKAGNLGRVHLDELERAAKLRKDQLVADQSWGGQRAPQDAPVAVGAAA